MRLRRIGCLVSADQQHKLPRAWPCSPARCALATSASEKVRATGGEKRPDSISSPMSASAWTARPVSPLLKAHPIFPGPSEVGDRDDVLGAAGEFDELGQDAAAGDVECEVNTVARARANPLDEPSP